MRRAVVSIVVPAVLLLLASTAHAEWFLDGYLGASVTLDDELSFTTFNRERTQEVNYKSSPVFGLRAGRWFAGLPWLGVAIDGSFFRPTEDINVVPLTALVLARYGFLPDDEFKEGRLHAYAGLGGGVFISSVDGTIGFQEASDSSVDMGLDVRAGVSYRVETNWALFFEYRFTHVSPSFDITPFGGRTSADTTFSTNHFLLGASYRF
jgi:hypothetical protein